MPKRYSSMGSASSMVNRDINNTAYDNVKVVADMSEDVAAIATALKDDTFKDTGEVAKEPLKSNINAVGAISDDVEAVAANITNITDVLDISTDIRSVSPYAKTIGDNSNEISIVGNSIGDVRKVASIQSSVTAVAPHASIIADRKDDIAKVANRAYEVETVANISGDVSIVSKYAKTIDDRKFDIENVALNQDNVVAVGTNINDVKSVASNMETIKEVEGKTEEALDSSNKAQLSKWEAEANSLTAESHASADENTLSTIFTSNGDGTFTQTPSNDYSALHYSLKAKGLADGSTSAKVTDLFKHGIPSGSLAVTTSGQSVIIGDGAYYINGVQYNASQTTFSTSSFAEGSFGVIGIRANGQIVSKANSFFTEVELSNTLEVAAFAKVDGGALSVAGGSNFDISNFIKDTMVRRKAFEGTIYNGKAGLISKSTSSSTQLNISSGVINTPNAKVVSIENGTNISGVFTSRTGGSYTTSVQSPLVATDIKYDNGSDLVDIPTGKYTSHTVNRSSRTGTVYLVAGTELFDNVAEALNASPSLGQFGTNNALAEVDSIAKIIVLRGGGITNVVDIRNNTSSIVSTVLPNVDMQTTYDLSGTPQITLSKGNTLEIRNSPVPSIAIQRWTDNAGNIKAVVDANGEFYSKGTKPLALREELSNIAISGVVDLEDQLDAKANVSDVSVESSANTIVSRDDNGKIFAGTGLGINGDMGVRPGNLTFKEFIIDANSLYLYNKTSNSYYQVYHSGHNAGAGIDADLVGGTEAKYLKGHTMGNNHQDPNALALTAETILTDHSNGPRAGYHYITTTFFSGSAGNRSQIAHSYADASQHTVYARNNYSGKWTPWKRIDNAPTISVSEPSGGIAGDIWYQVDSIGD